MIRADVNMTGTIKRSATTRTDKNEKPYLSFVVNVKLPDAKGKGRDLDVLVTFQGGKKSDLSLLTEKQRVTVQGTLDIRKKGKTWHSILRQTRFQSKMCQTRMASQVNFILEVV